MATPKSKTAARTTKKAAPASTAPKKKAAPAASSTKGASENELRTILEELQQHTAHEISEKLKSGTAGVGKDIGDFYDLATEERERELELLLGDRERSRLRQINEAFQRLEEGTYGICEECGEPINPKRLRIVPFARTCVDCQHEKEHEERQMRERDDDKVYSVIATDRPASLDEDDEG